MKPSGKRRPWIAVMATFALAAPLAAQSMEGTGVVATGLLLRQMDGVKRVLMIGAHPDDEDTSLLTTLARGWGAETAYLSLTRGDGGQNLIGSELFEGLGVVRTGELVAARRIDGGLQFFTRAFDYGFSKSADEALSLWPREELLGDVVWVIRRFRPHVVVSEFSGTPRDGHGQHQAAGIMAREAFAAAGDPARFPHHLALGAEPWAPAKLYESVGGSFGRGSGPPADGIRIPTGDLDPLLGRSLFQLSMESRSQHRSQEMGAARPLGPRSTGVRFIESRVGGAEGGIFEGIDTTLVGLTAGLPAPARDRARAHLEAYRLALRRAVDEFGLDLSAITDDLAEALQHLAQAREAAGGAADTELRTVLASRTDVAARAFMAAAGIVFDVRAADDLLVPGQIARVEARLWNASSLSLSSPEVALSASIGWSVTEAAVEGLAPDGSVAPGTLATWSYDVRLPQDAEPARLYFLRDDREGAWYRWPTEPELWGLPRDPSPVTGAASFTPRAEGWPFSAPRTTAAAPWRYVGVNPAEGEFERDVLVVPALSVDVRPDGMVWPAERTGSRSVSVVVRTEADGGSRGTLGVEAPPGWSVSPASRRFDLPGAGMERTLTFDIRPDGAATPGEHVFGFEARVEGGGAYAESYTLVDYEHIQRAALFAPAAARVTVVPVAVAGGMRVGYIMGSGDDGPEAIRQLGAEVQLLSESQVREGAFDAFDAIVLGVRAYETRGDLRAASEQVLDFARAGGTVVAQYNRGPLGGLAPLPLRTGRGSPRVSDETAPVRILDPEAPVFTGPNSIVPMDFAGWVQERGLYFASEWDDAWVPLLELNDSGEEPHRGSLLVTSVGDGVFVFTALSFFRQWSAGVPGAYRLFANLISLDPAEWRAYAAGR